MLDNNKILKITKTILVIMTIMSVLLAIGGVASASDVWKVPTATGGSLVNKTQDLAGIILGVIQAVGMSIAVIILVWLGIKYIMASPDGKAEIKKQAFGYILGAVLLFGASWLVPLLKNVIDSASK